VIFFHRVIHFIFVRCICFKPLFSAVLRSQPFDFVFFSDAQVVLQSNLMHRPPRHKEGAAAAARCLLAANWSTWCECSKRTFKRERTRVTGKVGKVAQVLKFFSFSFSFSFSLSFSFSFSSSHPFFVLFSFLKRVLGFVLLLCYQDLELLFCILNLFEEASSQ
jgi:hypothetical protein